ncbi:unnamed protein product [Hydatigera taeniaeformis]|uniref:MMS19 nucleotide excision repair protein n=1 Tax=Hydatigena taeniaeformis TaxID=6205 RepID=A0A0R3WQZ7_HYDTA|nr:unnamed protein product [Hydatigera taeniaeformis]
MAEVEEKGSSFEALLDSCTILLRPRKRDKKNVDDIFNTLGDLFKLVVEEKPVLDSSICVINSYCTNVISDGQHNLPALKDLICMTLFEIDGVSCDSLPLGPLASKLIDYNFLSKLVSWSATGEFVPSNIKYFALQNLLLNFDFLISQAKQSLLFSTSILQPLLRLIVSCREFSEHLSEYLSRLLYTLSVLLCRDPILLEFSKQVSHDVTRDEYFIFSQLVPLLHLHGPSGTNAQDALLLILALSDRDAEVANYLTLRSDICPVLATGLSGHYSCLPKRIVSDASDGERSSKALRMHSADWHRISRSEWSKCEPLVRFLQTLDFCNLAIRV